MKTVPERVLFVNKAVVWRCPSWLIFLIFKWSSILLSILVKTYCWLNAIPIIVSALNELYLGRINNFWLISPGYSIIELWLLHHISLIKRINLRIIVCFFLRIGMDFNVKMLSRVVMSLLIKVFTRLTPDSMTYVYSWLFLIIAYLLSSFFENGVLNCQVILHHFKTAESVDLDHKLDNLSRVNSEVVKDPLLYGI